MYGRMAMCGVRCAGDRQSRLEMRNEVRSERRKRNRRDSQVVRQVPRLVPHSSSPRIGDARGMLLMPILTSATFVVQKSRIAD